MMDVGIATFALAAVAGFLTLINPCVLPLLPAVAAGAAGQHRFGLPALGMGMAVAFTAVGVLFAGGGKMLGLSSGDWRGVAAVLMLVVGMLLLSERLRSGLARLMTPAGSVGWRFADRFDVAHPGAQFGVGALLGMAWSPCIGPTLGAAMSLAASGERLVEVVLVMTVFSMAAVIPLIAAGGGARHLMRRKQTLARVARTGRLLLGLTLVVIGLLVISRLDKVLEAWLLSIAPEWLILVTTRL